MPEPRIGVFVCGCGGRVSGRLDLGRLEAMARELPGVVFAQTGEMLCAGPEKEGLAHRLKKAGADRVLFAGCSARTSLRFPERFLAGALLAAGSDPALFEVANLREQCAFLHDPGPAADAKAADEIRMAHARLLGDCPRGPDVRVNPRALVIGGGPAGLSAARELSGMGTDVTLVEKNAWLGGRLCQIGLMFQTEKWPGKCVSACVGPVQAVEALTRDNIHAYLQSSVTRIERKDGNFTATLRRGPAFVDPDKCTASGACASVCPEFAHSGFEEGLFARKAIDKDFPRAVPDVYNLLPEFCTRCGACVAACPTGAIRLDAEPSTETGEFGAVFLATGFTSPDLSPLPEYGADLPDVVTGMQFERLLDRGVKRPSDGRTPEHIVFVLCAGSRATREKQGRGVPYCSRTCCGITMKQAQRVAMSMPETEVTILYYWDLRTYERTFEALHDTVRRLGVEFVQGRMDGVSPAGEGRLAVEIEQLGSEAESDLGGHAFEDGRLTLPADLVVLASAQVPEPGAAGLLADLRLKRDDNGFPLENQPRIFRPTESMVDRVYVIGSALGPQVIQQAVEQGRAAAMTALPGLLFGKKERPKFASSIDPAKCIACRMCEAVCPHGAIEVTEAGVVSDPAFCQGCGFCAAACPTHAAALSNFSDAQILAQANAAFTGLAPGEPRIMALLCYWCSYAAADLAGASGMTAPVNFRSIRIRCSSSVNTALVLEMFKRGVDGILVAGCPPRGCHHANGNYLADRRTALIQRVLDQLGISPARLKFDYIGVSNSREFVAAIADMDAKLRALGPNPVSRASELLTVEAAHE